MRKLILATTALAFLSSTAFAQSDTPKAKPVAMTPTHGIRTYRSENVKLAVIGMRPGECSIIQNQ